MENQFKSIKEAKEAFQEISNKIDRIISEESKNLPKGVTVSSIGRPELLNKKWNIPQGENIGFVFIIENSTVDPIFLK